MGASHHRGVVSEIGIPTYPKLALHLSQPTNGSETKHNKTPGRLIDKKREWLTGLLYGYPYTRGKPPSLRSGRTSLIGKDTDRRHGTLRFDRIWNILAGEW